MTKNVGRQSQMGYIQSEKKNRMEEKNTEVKSQTGRRKKRTVLQQRSHAKFTFSSSVLVKRERRGLRKREQTF